MRKTAVAPFAALAACAFLLSSCDSVLAGIGGLMCGLAPDTDHCRQWQAVQSGDAAKCGAIKGTKFKGSGSNPPRDKCYLQVAQNKGDYGICSNIKGGPLSYTRQECLLGVAIKKDDPAGCAKLAGFATEQSQCRTQLASAAKLEADDAKLQALRDRLSADPRDAQARKEMEAVRAALSARYQAAAPADQNAFFSSRREAIMGDVEDDDVKSAIAKSFTSWRGGSGEKDPIKQLEKMDQIKEVQQAMKRADEEAGELVNTVQEQLQGIIDEKTGEIQDDIAEKVGDKAKEWFDKNAGEGLKRGLGNLQWAMDKYEKGSKQYEELKGKYDKLKGIYDELAGTYQRVDAISKMAADGKIDPGQAKVLKGAVLLDKGLEYATSYVPVFGSTMSKVSKATFDTVIRVAKVRAERTNSMQKCIDDPANCDPSGITAY
jgi:hypothetical protein